MGARTDRLRDYLAQQASRVRAGDELLAAHADGAVHDTRVAVRRVRSALRTFSRLAPGPRRQQVDDGLRAWGRLLGGVRDLEVLRALLDEVAEPALRQALAADLDRRTGEAWAAVHAALLSEEHRTLLDELDTLVLTPPRRRVHPRRRARRAAEKAAERLAAADDEDTLHRARKAAKRARYAAEAVGLDGSGHEAVQDALGDHRDAVSAAAFLRDCGLPAAATARARAALEERAEAALRAVDRP